MSLRLDASKFRLKDEPAEMSAAEQQVFRLQVLSVLERCDARELEVWLGNRRPADRLHMLHFMGRSAREALKKIDGSDEREMRVRENVAVIAAELARVTEVNASQDTAA